MQQSEFSQLPGLSEVMAKRFQIMEDAISRGTLENPKTTIGNTYFWYASFSGKDRRRNLGINFSWGAFLLGPFWYVHFSLIKEAFWIMLIGSLIISFFPPDFDFPGAALAVCFPIYFTATRYAKYKITGSLNQGGNPFITILLTIGISIAAVIPAIIINILLYGWE